MLNEHIHLRYTSGHHHDHHHHHNHRYESPVRIVYHIKNAYRKCLFRFTFGFYYVLLNSHIHKNVCLSLLKRMWRQNNLQDPAGYFFFQLSQRMCSIEQTVGVACYAYFIIFLCFISSTNHLIFYIILVGRCFRMQKFLCDNRMTWNCGFLILNINILR